MKPVKDARRIALRAHSMWANYLGILCLVAPEVIFWLWGIDTNPRIWWIAGIALIVYGIAGRMIDQNITRSPALVMVFAIAMSAAPVTVGYAATGGVSPAAFLEKAVPLVAGWEGKENEAYLDRIASPPVWTVCYGETRGIGPGDYFTDAECRDMLERGLIEYRSGLHDYFTQETKQRRLTPERDAAYVSLAWNVGIRGAGRSTATRRLNAGDIAGGCEAITWWTRAGDRVVRGLVRRRADEFRLCMMGVA